MRIRRNKKSTNRNSGFTLLELLLVMAILVVLASLSTMAIFSIQGNALHNAAVMEIGTLEKACKAYRLNVGIFPQKLEDLYTNPSGLSKNQWGGPYMDKIPADPWRREYSYSADENLGTVKIQSAGPDGQVGTEDDVPDPQVAG